MRVAKKVAILVGAAFGTLLLAAVWWLFSYPFPGEVSTAIGREVRSARTGTIDLGKVAPFAWTEMLSFGPYQFREDICPVLDLTGFECWWTVPDIVDERYYFVVFRERQRITHCEHHARINGDFYDSGLPRPLLRRDAIFTFSQKGVTTRGDPWFTLKHSPSSTLSLNREAKLPAN
jgi:hypothetical protein